MGISLYASLKSKLSYSVMFGCFFTLNLSVLKMPVSSIPVGCFPTESKSVASVSKGTSVHQAVFDSLWFRGTSSLEGPPALLADV